MFNAAKALLLAMNVRRTKHAGVIAAFGENFAKPGRLPVDTHRWLMAAGKDRLIADYEASLSPAPDDVKEHIRNAATFLAAARDYLANN